MEVPTFEFFSKEAEEMIRRGGIGVVPTDTIYGMVCDAKNPSAVEKIYQICERDLNKPFIVTIGGFADLEYFEIYLTSEEMEVLKKYWPGEVSVVFDCNIDKFAHIHRGCGSIAIRFPMKKSLVEFMKKTGPLIATSANPQGLPHAESIDEAKEYFSDKVDFYLDSGKIISKSSTLIKLEKGKIKILREGSVNIK